VNAVQQLGSISNYVWAYALFAFLLSLIREILKDIQDMKGDMATGYRTLPIVLGLNPARVIASVIIILLAGVIAIVQWYLYHKGFVLPFWYLLVVVQPLLLYLFMQLLRYGEANKYGFLSNTSKIIMLAGVLSMELIYISL
jgi:4-hydroxybenzoate polyprenyltransferase